MRSRLVKTGTIVLALIATLAVPASAHHSFAAEYDAKKPVTLKGTVTKVEWVNPHGWIYIDVKGPSGKVANWAVEAGISRRAGKAGFEKDVSADRRRSGYYRLPGERRIQHGERRLRQVPRWTRHLFRLARR
jgi:hypothetical protein